MILIECLLDKKTSSIPFWFMRQAGRYLPEYKAVRSKFPNFLSFCYTPEAACEVTLQPIARFDMSAAIIFSDILVIPDALGMDVAFKESIGPVLVPLKGSTSIQTLKLDALQSKLEPVYKAISLTRNNLAKDKALIGFCGAPWTLACYMLQGKSSRDFAEARQFALKQPDDFTKLLNILIQAVTTHAQSQIEAGANAIQLFDSWSGILSEYEFSEYVIKPNEQIVVQIKKKYPHIPIIGFPRMCGTKLIDYARQTKVNAVSIDGSVNLDYARTVPSAFVLQGNLDSQILAEDKSLALSQTKNILEKMRGRSFVFNLAHGILPHTPIDHVQAVSDMIKAHNV